MAYNKPTQRRPHPLEASSGRQALGRLPLSLRTRFILVLAGFTFVLASALGWVAYRTAYDTVVADAKRAMGIAANGRRDALRGQLQRQQRRADRLLRLALASCDPGAPDQTACLREELAEFVATEGATAARLTVPETGPIAIGEHRISPLMAVPAASGGQFARFGFDEQERPYYVVWAYTGDGAAAVILRFETQAIADPFLDQWGLGASGETFLVDERGFFLTSPRYPDSAGESQPLEAAPMGVCLAQQEAEQVATDYRGVAAVIASRYLEESGGCVIAEIGEAEALAPVGALRGQILGVTAIVGVLALGAALALGQWFARPLRHLADRARGLEKGDFESPVPVEGPTEVRTFARAFTAMAQSLRKSRAEADLERARLREVFTQAPAAIRVTRGPDHVMEFGNPAYFQLVGPREVGKPLRETLPELGGQGYFELVDKVYATGEPYVANEYPARLHWGGGALKERFFNHVILPLRNPDSAVEGTLLHAVDVTEQVRARQRIEVLAAELREREEQFRRLIEATFGTVVILENGVILEVNEAWTAMFGYAAAETVGRSALDFVAPESRDLVKRYIAAGYDKPYEAIGLHKDGTRFHVEAVGEATRYQGRSVRIVGIRDITERKQAEEALRASEERYRLATRATNDAIWDWNLATGQVARSEAYRRVFGHAPDIGGPTVERATRWWLDHIHPDDRERVEAAFQSAVQGTAEGWEDKYRFRRADDNYAYVLDRCFIARNERGQPTRIVGAMQDVTERKRAEEALAQRADELARSNTELEQFAYIASHDLQEPLRAVVSYLQLLEQRYKSQLDERADKYISYALDGGRRMQQLVADLLAYSRVGRRDEPSAADGEAALARALANLRAAVAEGGATVTHDPLPTVQADATQLVQLFQNLVGNALKFRGPAPPRVHVWAERRGEERAWRFAVRDNGPGIAPEFQQRVFGLFQRLHARGEYPGTGLGLAICRKIVERHGGRLWVESEPGHGSTFYFTLTDQRAAV